MNKYFELLGIPENATEEELRLAYRELAKKYHPDNFNDPDDAMKAKAKMDEINEAYDYVVGVMKNRSNNNGAENFKDVKNLITSGRFEEAQEVLDGVPINMRTAEWYYLNGVVLEKRGWFKNAYTSYSTACQLDPDNFEYRNAYQRIQKNRSGLGYGMDDSYVGGCSCCDMCVGAMCVNMCCDAFRCC